MADARGGPGRYNRGRGEAGDAQDGEVGRRIPADKLGVERLAVVAGGRAGRPRGQARESW